MARDNYYEENHEQYFAATVGIDPSVFLSPLVRLLKPGAAILDIGCGSGRDLLWLSRCGFRPTGFERSPGLSRLAREHSGCPVIEGDFTSYDFSEFEFSALMLVGALVHQVPEVLPGVLNSVCEALAPGGLLLITLKEGNGISKGGDGRGYTLWARECLERIYSQNNLHTLHFFRQTSLLRPADIWLGHVVRLET